MAVLSPDHHAHHLQTEEEVAEFYRTAPIVTRAYWDLADEISRRDSRPEEIRIHRQAVDATLEERAIPGRDDVRRQDAARTMAGMIREVIREY